MARIWIDYANTRFTGAFGKLRAASEPEQREAQSELAEVLRYIDREGLQKLPAEGPFFLGAAPSLVDFAFYPWFERWPALAHYRGFELPAELQRLTRWLGALQGLESVKAHANAAPYYIERYARYAAK